MKLAAEEVEDVLLVALGIGRVERELAVAVSSKLGPLVSRWAMTELPRRPVALHPVV